MMKLNVCLMIAFFSASLLVFQGCGGSGKKNTGTQDEKKIVLSLPDPDEAFNKYNEAIVKKDVPSFKATISEGHLEKLEGIIATIKMQNRITENDKAWEHFIEKECTEWKDLSLKRYPVKTIDATHAEINCDVKDPDKFTNIRVYLVKEGTNWKVTGCSKFNSSKYIKQIGK